MSIGIVLIDLTPGFQSDFMGYLFGSMLAVDDTDIYYMVGLLLLIVWVIAFFYRDILCVSYDREYAKLKGISTSFFHTLILLLSAFSTIIAIRVVGIILVIALLSIPIYLAERFSSSLLAMMFISSILSAIFTLVGLALSYTFDLSSGASIVLVGSGVLCSIMGYDFIKKIKLK